MSAALKRLRQALHATGGLAGGHGVSPRAHFTSVAFIAAVTRGFSFRTAHTWKALESYPAASVRVVQMAAAYPKAAEVFAETVHTAVLHHGQYDGSADSFQQAVKAACTNASLTAMGVQEVVSFVLKTIAHSPAAFDIAGVQGVVVQRLGNSIVVIENTRALVDPHPRVLVFGLTDIRQIAAVEAAILQAVAAKPTINWTAVVLGIIALIVIGGPTLFNSLAASLHGGATPASPSAWTLTAWKALVAQYSGTTAQPTGTDARSAAAPTDGVRIPMA